VRECVCVREKKEKKKKYKQRSNRGEEREKRRGKKRKKNAFKIPFGLTSSLFIIISFN